NRRARTRGTFVGRTHPSLGRTLHSDGRSLTLTRGQASLPARIGWRGAKYGLRCGPTLNRLGVCLVRLLTRYGLLGRLLLACMTPVVPSGTAPAGTVPGEAAPAETAPPETLPAQLYELTTETGMPHLEENLRYTTRHERVCLTHQSLSAAFPILQHPSL